MDFLNKAKKSISNAGRELGQKGIQTGGEDDTRKGKSKSTCLAGNF